MRAGGGWWRACVFALVAMAGACDCSGTRLIHTRNDGTMRVITGDVVSCDGKPVKLEPIVTGGHPPYTYQWSPADHVDAPTSLATNADADDTRAYVLTVTDAIGWSVSGTSHVIRRAPPVAKLAITQGAQLTCAGTQVTLDASQSTTDDGTPLAGYIWDLGDGSTPVSTKSPTKALVPKDGESVALTIIDDVGCRGTASETLNVRALPTPKVAFTQGSDAVCAGDEVALDASASTDADGQPVASFAWDLDGNASTIESHVATSGAFSPTSAPAHLTVTDSFGCAATLDTTIATKPNPTAHIAMSTASGPLCAGDAVTLDASGSTDGAGGQIASYAWNLSGVAGAVDSSDAKPPPITPIASKTVTLTVTGSDGCTNEASLVVAPRPLPKLPVVVASGDPNGCFGAAVTLSAAGATDADGNPVASTQWDLNGDGIPDASGPTANVTLTQSETASVTVTDRQGCRSTGTVSLNPRPLPKIVTTFATGSDKVCSGQLVSLDASQSRDADGREPAQFAWDLDGVASTIESTTSTSGAFAPTGAPAKVTVTDSHGCSATQSTSIAIRPSPVAAIHLTSSTPAMCAGSSVTFDGSASHDASGQPVTRYAWDLDGDASTVESTDAKPTQSVTRPGAATLTVYDATGCTATKTVTYSPRPNPVAPAVAINGDPAGCAGSTVSFGASNAVDADGNPVASTTWDLNGDGVVDTTGANASVTLANATNVTVTVTDAQGCSTSSTTALTPRALPTPKVVFARGAATVCSGDEVDLDASGSVDADGKPVAAYAWNLDGDATTVEATSATSGDFTPQGAPAELTVTDAKGCSASLATDIAVNVRPTAVISFDQGSSQVCDGTTIAVDGLASRDASGAPVMSYAWDFDSDPTTIESTDASPPAFVTATGRDLHLTVTDANGCTGETVTRLTSHPLPKAIISLLQGSADACQGTALQLSGSASTDASGQPVTSWTWSYGEAPNGSYSGATTPAFVPASSENVALTVVDENNCSATTTLPLSPRGLPTPKVAFVQGAAESCAGTSVALSAAGSTDADGNPVSQVAWDLNSNGSVDSTSVQTAPFTPASSQTAHLTVTDAQGCSASVDQPLTVDALPNARIVFAQGSFNVCDGTTIGLDGSLSADASGAPVSSYAWDFDGDASTVESTAAKPTPFAANGVTVAKLTVADQHGCTNSSSVTVTGRGLPSAKIAVATPHAALCSGDDVTLSGDGSVDVDGNPVANFAWNLDGNASTVESTSADPTPFAVTSPETVGLTVVDAKGCRGTATTTLTPRALPTPNIAFASGRADVCLGGAVSLTDSASKDADGNPVAETAWDLDSNGTIDSTATTTPAFTPSAPETTTLTVTDVDGCSASTTQHIAPRALPTASIAFATGGPLVCSGNGFSLDGSASKDADGNAVAQYAWDVNGDGATDQTGATTNVVTPAASTTVALHVTDGEGCVGSATKSVSVRALPQARIAFVQGASEVCSGAAAQLTGSSSLDADGNPVSAYAWDLDGNTSTIESNTSMPPAFDVTAPRTTTLTVTDVDGCRGTATQPLSAHALPVANAGGDAAICEGQSVRLGASPTSGVTYAWSPATGLDSASSSAPNASPSASTRYTVTAKDSFGCTATDDVQVTVHANPVANAGPDVLVADGGSVALSGSGSGGTAPYSYAWTPASTLTDATIASPRADPTVDTSYSLKVTDQNGCFSTDDAKVTVLPPMSVSVGPSKLFCRNSGKSLPLTGTVASGVAPFTYRWSSVPLCINCIASPTSASTTVQPSQDTTFTLTVTDANGSVASASVAVHVLDGLTVNAGPDRSVDRGGSTQLGEPGQPGLSYSWTCSDTSCGLSDFASPDPVAQPSGTTAYTVTATDGETCTATDTVLVTTDPQIIATVPTEGYSPWDRSSPIWAIFDTDLDPTTIPGNVTLVDPSDGTTIWIATSYDAPTRMLMVQPLTKCDTGCTGDHFYKNNNAYLLVLKGGPNGIRTLSGSPMYNDFTLEFTASSVGDGSAPQLTYRHPAWLETNVATSTQVVMTFDEPCDPRSVNASTIWIAGHPGTVTYDVRTWTATLKLAQPLAPNTSYVVDVVGVKDGPGNATNTSWTFTTGSGPDVTPPTVVSANPQDGATNFDVAGLLSVTFSEPVDTSTLGRLKVMDVAAQSALTGKVLYDASTLTATFQPTSFFDPSHTFELDLAGITDEAGNALQPWTATFTTASAIVAERFEQLPVGWTYGGAWGLDFQAARAGANGLSDSPGANYANSENVSVTSPPLNVRGKSNVAISLWTRRSLVLTNDVGYVETSPDGISWTAALTLSGPTGWRALTANVPTNGATSLKVRLRLSTDASLNLDGWFVDDLVVR